MNYELGAETRGRAMINDAIAEGFFKQAIAGPGLMSQVGKKIGRLTGKSTKSQAGEMLASIVSKDTGQQRKIFGILNKSVGGVGQGLSRREKNLVDMYMKGRFRQKVTGPASLAALGTGAFAVGMANKKEPGKKAGAK